MFPCAGLALQVTARGRETDFVHGAENVTTAIKQAVASSTADPCTCSPSLPPSLIFLSIKQIQDIKKVSENISWKPCDWHGLLTLYWWNDWVEAIQIMNIHMFLLECLSGTWTTSIILCRCRSVLGQAVRGWTMSNEVLLLRTYLLCEVHGFILRSFLFSKRTNNDQSNERLYGFSAQEFWGYSLPLHSSWLKRCFIWPQSCSALHEHNERKHYYCVLCKSWSYKIQQHKHCDVVQLCTVTHSFTFRTVSTHNVDCCQNGAMSLW